MIMSYDDWKLDSPDFEIGESEEICENCEDVFSKEELNNNMCEDCAL